jgi:hypothetical protein
MGGWVLSSSHSFPQDIPIEVWICEDLNRDGHCQDDEPSRSGIVIEWGDGCSATATDNKGCFSLRIAGRDMRVSAPNRYRDGSKFLAKLNTWMAFDEPSTTAGQGHVANSLANMQLVPLYGLMVVLVGMVLVGNLKLGGMLGALRRQHRQVAEWTMQADAYRQQEAIQARLNEQGPNGLAAQLISDVLRESFDVDLCVVGLSTQPAPHLIFARSGHRFIFTVNPDALKRAGLIEPWARSVALAKGGAMANVEAQMLWDRMVAQSGLAMRPVAPRNVDWYLVIDDGTRC